jgi:hypothetical protein
VLDSWSSLSLSLSLLLKEQWLAVPGVGRVSKKGKPEIKIQMSLLSDDDGGGCCVCLINLILCNSRKMEIG